MYLHPVFDAYLLKWKQMEETSDISSLQGASGYIEIALKH